MHVLFLIILSLNNLIFLIYWRHYYGAESYIKTLTLLFIHSINQTHNTYICRRQFWQTEKMNVKVFIILIFVFAVSLGNSKSFLIWVIFFHKQIIFWQDSYYHVFLTNKLLWVLQYFLDIPTCLRRSNIQLHYRLYSVLIVSYQFSICGFK